MQTETISSETARQQKNTKKRSARKDPISGCLILKSSMILDRLYQIFYRPRTPPYNVEQKVFTLSMCPSEIGSFVLDCLKCSSQIGWNPAQTKLPQNVLTLFFKPRCMDNENQNVVVWMMRMT